MKKLLTLALAAVLALSLVACGGSGSIKDGTYTAQYKEPSHDWTEYLSVTYKDGVITDVDFDAKDANGNLKSEATAETYPMDPLPSEWIPQLVPEQFICRWMIICKKNCLKAYFPQKI